MLLWCASESFFVFVVVLCISNLKKTEFRNSNFFCISTIQRERERILFSFLFFLFLYSFSLSPSLSINNIITVLCFLFVFASFSCCCKSKNKKKDCFFYSRYIIFLSFFQFIHLLLLFFCLSFILISHSLSHFLSLSAWLIFFPLDVGVFLDQPI